MKEKRKSSKSGNGQFYVRFNGKEEWQKVFKWLNVNHYNNVHRYSNDFYPNNPNVICIDETERKFFGTNVTCLACATTCGHKVIVFDEFKTLLY